MTYSSRRSKSGTAEGNIQGALEKRAESPKGLALSKSPRAGNLYGFLGDATTPEAKRPPEAEEPVGSLELDEGGTEDMMIERERERERETQTAERYPRGSREAHDAVAETPQVTMVNHSFGEPYTGVGISYSGGAPTPLANLGGKITAHWTSPRGVADTRNDVYSRPRRHPLTPGQISHVSWHTRLSAQNFVTYSRLRR